MAPALRQSAARDADRGADDLLDITLDRGGVEMPPIVSDEAAAAVAMLLLRDHGMLMVHFVGVLAPPTC